MYASFLKSMVLDGNSENAARRLFSEWVRLLRGEADQKVVLVLMIRYELLQNGKLD